MRYPILDKELLFDNGIWWEVFRSEELYRKFWEQLLERNSFRSDGYFLKTTPFVFIEAVGVSVKALNKRLDEDADLVGARKRFFDNLTEKNCNDKSVEFLGALQNSLRKYPELAQAALAEKLRAQAGTLIEKVRKTYLSVFEPIYLEDGHSQVIDALAIDRMQREDLAEQIKDLEIQRRYDVQFFGFLRAQLSSGGTNFSAVRATANLVRRMPKQLEKLGKPMTSEELVEFQEHLAEYDEEKELLDADIVHALVCGSIRNEKLREVAVFSNERYEAWQKRIGTHVRSLQFVDEFLKNQNIERFVLAPGLFFGFDHHVGEMSKIGKDIKREFEEDFGDVLLKQNEFVHKPEVWRKLRNQKDS